MINTEHLGTDARKILFDELTALRDRIAANIIQQGSNATGKTIASLQPEVEAKADGFEANLYARAYFGALETGAKPWKNAVRFKRFVPRVFAEQIQEWIDAKGLDLSAYAVAKTIIHEGTKLYREGGRDTIYSKEIPHYLDRMQTRLSVFFQTVSTETITLNTSTTA